MRGKTYSEPRRGGCRVAGGRLTRRQVVQGMAAGSVAGGLSAHGLTPAAHGQARDAVIVGMHQELEFLNVLYTQGGNSLSASKLAQRGLLFLDADSNWVGELAAEVPSLENGGVSEDGLTITYALRDGLTWHDGEPVTSADVQATWDMIMNPDYAVITRFGYDRIGSVETPDPLTVVLNFSEPFASWPILFDAIIPKHVIEANADNLDESEAMRTPIGFGPYRIVEYRTGESIEYEAFDGYWNGRPIIDRFFIRIYPSVDALMQAVAAQEVDIAWAVPISYVPQIEGLESQGVILVSAPSANAERYVMNADAEQNPLFADKALRQALQHAVDKQQIIDALLFGLAEPGLGEWQGSPWQNPDLPPYEYDPDLCRELLDGLGWVPGADGVREKDGQRLTFSHKTTSGNQLRENVQLLVQQQFRDVGVEMVIENQRTADLFGTWDQGGQWSRGEYQMGGWSHGLRVPDPEVSNRYLCSEIASEENPAGSQWYRYCNPEVDELLNQQATTFDVEERQALIFEVQELLHEEAYWIWLYAAETIYTAPAALHNFVLHPFANFYWNPQEWAWA
jgi:peptide/nickel transport system substrate-binding protein